MVYFTTLNFIFFTLGAITLGVCCLLYRNFRVKKLQEWQYQEKKVSNTDLDILQKIQILLDDQNNWDHCDTRICLPGEKLSLFCAIAFATREIAKSYTHWGVVNQEIRLVIVEHYPERWTEHPIMDFNNHHETTHSDIIMVLSETQKRLMERLRLQS